MKLLLLIFVHVLSASELGFSPVLFHLLFSNGYLSSLIDIESLMNSPSTHSKELVQIVTEAQKSTRLVMMTFASEYESDTADIACLRSVLATANTLHYHQIVFQRNCDSLEYIADSYYLVLYWAKKDFEFLLSIKPQRNKALNAVLQSLHGKISKLEEEYDGLLPQILSYSNLMMAACLIQNSPEHPLPSFDVKWAKANDSAEPKVHYSLLSELFRRKIISTSFIINCKRNYYKSYQKFIKNKNDDDCELLGLYLPDTPTVILNHKKLYYSITSGWLSFWMLGVRIKRPMPIPAESAFVPSLMESFNIEIKAMEKVAKEDGKIRKYALECSCRHMDYLIGCMRLALLFDLLNHQEHTKCIALIITHHELALEMIDNLASKVQ